MNFKILVIDDEWEKRKNNYKALENEITSRHSSFKVCFEFLEKPDISTLRLLIYNNNYSAIITDAVLNGNPEWVNFSINHVIDLIDDIPIAVVSERWDNTNSKEIAKAWNKKNCRTFLHWRDIDPSGRGQVEYAIELIICMITEPKKLNTNLSLQPDEDLRIVHISDVHTSGIDQKRISHMAQGCANSILKYWNDKPPAFVAFTGDVTEYGSPSQYNFAYNWILDFFRHLRMQPLPSRNVLYVPGNHDVNLYLASASKMILKKDGDKIKFEMRNSIKQPDLIEYAYAPFQNFLHKVTDLPLFKNDFPNHKFSWVESSFRHLGIIFYGINTCDGFNDSSLPKRTVDVGILNRLEEELGLIKHEENDQKPIIIGLGHHSPVAESEDGAVLNLDDFRRFFQGKGKTDIFLHGHCHKGVITDEKINNERIVRSGAPSFSKESKDRPEDTLRGYNLLTIKRNNHFVTSLDISSFVWYDGSVSEIKKTSYEYKNEKFVETA